MGCGRSRNTVRLWWHIEIASRQSIPTVSPVTRPSPIGSTCTTRGPWSSPRKPSKRGGRRCCGFPGGFSRTWAEVAGEELSLDDVEHGKIRRFGDPRIHGALVCGSVSCPTLRYEPYAGDRLDAQLDAQMRAFLAGGGARVDRDRGVLGLSRVFLWYGGDFTRPHRMPTWLPARRRHLTSVISRWLSPADATWVAQTTPTVEFAPYDWALACSIA